MLRDAVFLSHCASLDVDVDGFLVTMLFSRRVFFLT